MARIGDLYVSATEFEREIERTVGDGTAGLDSRVLSRLLDRFLDEEMLARLAVEREVARPEDSRRRAADLLLRSDPPAEPTGDEIAAWYRAHAGEFERPERVRLFQILVEERSRAEQALEEIGRGADFVEVARRWSRDPSAETGGDQGELSRQDLPPALVEPIFALAAGEVSGIVEAEYGFHIFMVREKLPAQMVPLADAASEVRSRLLEQAASRQLQSLLEEARSRYEVTVYERNLSFAYQGVYRGQDA